MTDEEEAEYARERTDIALRKGLLAIAMRRHGYTPSDLKEQTTITGRRVRFTHQQPEVESDYDEHRW